MCRVHVAIRMKFYNNKLFFLVALLILVGFIFPVTTHAADLVPPFVVSYYPLPIGGRVLQIVSGSDGNLWFTVDRTGLNIVDAVTHLLAKPVVGSVGKITTAGTITEFSLPEATSSSAIDESVDSVSFAIATGPDGNLWFTDAYANKIGKMTPGGIVTEYSLSYSGMWPRSITKGPDGNIWFMTAGYQKSIIVSMTTAGTIVKELPVPGYDSFGQTDYGHSLTFGSDGNLWFRGTSYTSIGRMTPAGVYTEFATSGVPINIIPGINSDLWSGLSGGNLTQITTAGVITSYPTPGDPAWTLAMSADHTLWFKTGSTKDIKEIPATGGNITVDSLSTAETYVTILDMVFGQDGNIWFADSGRIGRIEVTSTPTPTIVPSPSPTVTPTPISHPPAPKYHVVCTNLMKAIRTPWHTFYYSVPSCTLVKN